MAKVTDGTGGGGQTVHGQAAPHREALAFPGRLAATRLGIDGHAAERTDFGPAGVAARAGLPRSTPARLARTEPFAGPERLAGPGACSEGHRLPARGWSGVNLDLVGTYHCGRMGLHRVEEEMVEVAGRTLPGEPAAAGKHLLENC